jgi:glycosyltransferase involved in cell wall biosynthesis
LRANSAEANTPVNVGPNASAPWLTVIIPSYRGEQWIATALTSLANEPTDGIEVLVIDGSPTPATRSIAQGYSDCLRLKVFERCDLQSWQQKTNFGVASAESSHVCWLGVDDVWFPGRALAAKAWIAAAPNAAIHLAPSAIIDQDGRKLGVWRCPLPANIELSSNLVVERLLVQNFIAAPAPVFRRDTWLNCGGLDEKLWYTADWDIWLKLVGIGSVYYHDPITVGFRIHDGSLTSTGSRDADNFANQMQIVLDRHISKHPGLSRQTEPVARASIAVNVALASASAGDLGGLWRAATEILRLGPAGIRRYLRDSRIAERVVPRVRAKFASVF